MSQPLYICDMFHTLPRPLSLQIKMDRPEDPCNDETFEDESFHLH